MSEGEVQYLLDNEILRDIFDGLERDAIEAAVSADTDELRASSLGEVRAIRSVRRKLKTLLSVKTNPEAVV